MSMNHTVPRALLVALVAIASAACSDGAVAQSSVAMAKGDHKVTDSYKKPSEGELKKKLSPIQFEVTQKEGTERPFQNEFWDNHEDGIYVDVVSGEALFSSQIGRAHV